jgi:hypothetical protein
LTPFFAALAAQESDWRWPKTKGEPGTPVNTSPKLRRLLRDSADEIGIPLMQMHSGAGHDLMNFYSENTKIALIFVPSIQGLSHNPGEDTSTGSITKAYRLLHHYLVNHQSAGTPEGEDEKTSIIAREKAATKEAEIFTDEIKLRAKSARESGKRILIGIDTEWIENSGVLQQAVSQRLINSLTDDVSRLLEDMGLDNIDLVRGRGQALASRLKEKADREGISYSDIVILADEGMIDDKAYAPLKDEDPERSALLIGVSTKHMAKEAGFREGNYLRILEMITAALKSYNDPGKALYLTTESLHIKQISRKTFIFIPRADPIDIGTLKRIYDLQREAVTSA